jgi:hypothetical protein
MALQRKNSKKVVKGKQRRERRGYYFGDVSIAEINQSLRTLKNDGSNNEDFQSLRFGIAMSMVAALHLCQLRQQYVHLSSQQVEQLASYRHIKKKYTLSSTSPVITGAAFLAAIKISPFVKNIASVEDLTRLTHSLIDSFSPNSKVIEGPTSDNYSRWAEGFMARHVGLFSSCPSTNANYFGFSPEDLKNGTTESILLKLGETGDGFEAKEINEGLNQCIATDGGGFDIYTLTFPDPPIQSPIEAEIFKSRSEFQFFRTGSTSLETGGINSKGASQTDLELLSGIEQVLFEQALKVGDKSTLDRINKKIKEIKTKMNEVSVAKKDDDGLKNPVDSDTLPHPGSFDSALESVIGQVDSSTGLNQSKTTTDNNPTSSLVPSKFKAVSRKGRQPKEKISETQDGGTNSP